MNEHDVLAERFEAHRPRLRALAYQTLGSPSEADDAVQEAWLRLSCTVPFDEIAAVVGRSPAAARQLASRARRRVQDVARVIGSDLRRQRANTDAFLIAALDWDFPRCW